MSIKVNSNLLLGSPQYLDSRQSVTTIEELLSLNTNIIPEGFECYVEELDIKYKYRSDHPETDTGKWKKVEIEGNVPYIGDNGNWYIGEEDTGISAIGEKGQDAYQVATSMGFDGTREEWIESLKGKDGIDGTNGMDGIDGMDAYQVATSMGFDGTREEWIESLKGKDGISPIINIGGNGNWYVDGVDTGVSAKGEKGETGQGFSATKHYNTIDEMIADTDPVKESEVVVVINENVGNFYLRLSSYIDPNGITNGYLPIGNTDDISTIQGRKGEDGATPTIDPNTKHWFINGIDTGIVAEGKDAETPYIGSNDNWFIGETDTGILARGKDGRSIVSIDKDDKNNMIVTFSDGSVENIGKLSVNIQGDFLTENGFGNLRYYNTKFQYYDSVSNTWVDAAVSPENAYIIQIIPQAVESIGGFYDIELGKNKLRWTEPKDTIIDGQVVCLVEKVIIRRKLGSVPINETDGDLVIELNRSDFGSYTNTYFVDEEITPVLNEVWYYKAFPISTMGFCNSSSVNEISILCKDHYLYGFKIDQNEADSYSMITYIEDNANYKYAYMDYTTGLFNYGDWEDAWFIRDLKPCMLNYDGTVAYELNKNDYTLKADGTASDITNSDFSGNAMIGFPKVYWKIVDNGDDTANIYFSNKKVDEDFVCWSHIDNNGNEIDYCYMPIYNGSSINSVLRSLSGKTVSGSKYGTTEITQALANNQTEDVIWYTEVFSDRQLVNLLLLLIGKTGSCQGRFGYGNYNSGASASYILKTGTMDKKGLFWGADKTNIGVKVFGMEHYWANQNRRIAGIIGDKGVIKVKMTYGQSDGSTVDGYNTTAEGYIPIYSGPAIEGLISKMLFDKHGLIPIAAGASYYTYYADYASMPSSSGTNVLYPRVGGSSNSDNGSAGPFMISFANTIKAYYWYIGASISCKPLAII